MMLLFILTIVYFISALYSMFEIMKHVCTTREPLNWFDWFTMFCPVINTVNMMMYIPTTIPWIKLMKFMRANWITVVLSIGIITLLILMNGCKKQSYYCTEVVSKSINGVLQKPQVSTFQANHMCPYVGVVFYTHYEGKDTIIYQYNTICEEL